MGCRKFTYQNFSSLKIVYRKKKVSEQKKRIDYYPFGMPMPGRQIVNGQPYRYAFQGQEKDPETGKEAFELRLWDGRIGRWLTTDPAGQYSSLYLGMGNNPVNGVDPNGAVYNPVYGSDGTFRGVDEFGLKGEAIVFDGTFTNGMKQSDILDNGGKLLGDYLSFNPNFFDTKAFENIYSHFNGLSSRPDYDGRLNFMELVSWRHFGDGQPLFVDAIKINLSPLNAQDFNKNNLSRSIDFFPYHDTQFGNRETGFAFGHIQVTLLNATTGKVRLGVMDRDSGLYIIDRFDFRNPIFEFIADNMYQGIPQDFFIIPYNRITYIPTQRINRN